MDEPNPFASDPELSSSPTAWVLGTRAEAEAAQQFAEESKLEWTEDDDDFDDDKSNFKLFAQPSSDLKLSVDSREFFLQLCTSDKVARRSALTSMIHELEKFSSESDNPHITKSLPTVRRLAEECPFKEIRKSFTALICLMKERGYEAPKAVFSPSYFVPNIMVTPINTESSLLKRLFKNSFIQYGRVSHVTRLLAWHPKLLRRRLGVYNRVMCGPGALRDEWRHYIAIMAAASFKCRYLVRLQEKEFLLAGGEATWLRGLQAVPEKLRNLAVINALLASQPWRIRKEHVEQLFKHEDRTSRWTVGEFVHALVIMSMFRELAGVVFGCGVAPELDLVEPVDIEDGVMDGCAPEDIPLEEDQRHQMSDETDKIYKSLLHDAPDESVIVPAECRKYFEDLTSSATETSPAPPSGELASTTRDLSRFLYCDETGTFNVEHANFHVKSDECTVFRVQDFNWKDHGYSLMSRYFGDVAPLIDEYFSYGRRMTDNRISEHKNVDTGLFRTAVWYYVHSIHGIMHDDYDYKYVNIYLNRSTKAFVKKVSCTPAGITRSDFANMGLALRPEEKLHVILLASLARKQAELLLGLHAVMNFMG